jgi:hypothetical protein
VPQFQDYLPYQQLRKWVPTEEFSVVQNDQWAMSGWNPEGGTILTTDHGPVNKVFL